MLRDGTTGDWIGTLLGHKGAVWSARLNEGATRAVTASADFTVKLWDAITGKELHTFAHRHIVKNAVFSRDDTLIYTGGNEKKLRIFDVSKPEAEPQIVADFEGDVTHITTSPDPNLIIVGGRQKNIRVLDRRTLKVEKTLDTPGNKVSGLSMSHDETVLSATSGNDVLFYNATNFELIKKLTLPRELNCVSYHPKAGRFVTGSESELWVRFYDFESGEEVACNKGHHGPVRCIGFNPTGDAYASGSEDGTIRIWEYAKNEAAAKEAASA